MQVQKNKKNKKKHTHNKFVNWLSHWSSYAKNKTINTLIFVFSLFVIMGTNYFIIFKSIFPKLFLLDFLLCAFLVAPIFFFKKTMFDRIYLPIIQWCCAAFFGVNACFHAYFGTIFALKDFFWALQNITQVGMHAPSIKWWIIILNGVYAIVFSLVLILYNAKWRFKETSFELKLRSYRKCWFTALTMFASAVMFEFSLQMWCIAERNKNIVDIDYVNYSSNYHFRNLGMMGYYIQELRQMTFDRGESVESVKEFLTTGTQLKDDYTGLLSKDGEPANIFVIVLETGDRCIVNEETTPNLCWLLNNGLDCSHNYSYNHTNVSDAIAITGNYPQYHCYDWKRVASPFALPHVLKDKYQSYFTHDLVKANDEYGRMAIIPGLGFDQCWYHNDIIPELSPWNYDQNNYTRDSLYIDGLIKKMKTLNPDKPFYMHYLTVHMHMDQVITKGNKQMYQDLENEFGKTIDDAEQAGTWVNPFKNKNSSNAKKFRRLTLKAMDFDKGLGTLMDYLYGDDSSNYLKNTLLAVCADHSWYESTTNGNFFAQEIRHIYGNNNIKQYHTVLGMYHPKLVDKFNQDYEHQFTVPTWPTVLVPTILDLLGEKYNPNIYISKSIFDPTFDDNEIFYSFWTAIYMNEHFTSYDHYHINCVYDNNGDRQKFLQNLDKQKKQARIIDTIYKRNIFKKDLNYDECMPQPAP